VAGLAAGGLNVLAYGLVLWAQTRGALVFREPFGLTRIAAAVFVVAGIVLLNVG
jgi:multidrug transporter EmrE-like cation transporter